MSDYAVEEGKRLNREVANYDYSHWRGTSFNRFLTQDSKNPNVGHINDIPCDTYDAFAKTVHMNMKAAGVSIPEEAVSYSVRLGTVPPDWCINKLESMQKDENSVLKITNNVMYRMFSADAMEHMIALKKEGKVLGADVPCRDEYLQAGLTEIAYMKDRVTEDMIDPDIPYNIDTENLTDLFNEVSMKNGLLPNIVKSPSCAAGNIPFKRPHMREDNPLIEEAAKTFSDYLPKALEQEKARAEREHQDWAQKYGSKSDVTFEPADRPVMATPKLTEQFAGKVDLHRDGMSALTEVKRSSQVAKALASAESMQGMNDMDSNYQMD